MHASRSEYLTLRGLRTHLRIWGSDGAPRIYCLHGWMDVSASFQYLADCLLPDWQVIALDWRGFGMTERTTSGLYFFPEYLADLDALLGLRETGPIRLIGHSMGGNIACLYAGIWPERVSHLVTLEGFGLPPTQPAEAPSRYRNWLAEVADPTPEKRYASYGELAERFCQRYPLLPADRALFLARQSARELSDGQIELLADPRHRHVNPVLYRLEEAQACWRNITAPVLWLEGDQSQIARRFHAHPEDYAARQASFQRLTTQVLAHSDHMLHIEQPEIIGAALTDFFGAP